MLDNDRLTEVRVQMEEEVDDRQPPCPGCSSCLVEPYIRCAECAPRPFILCLHCFAKGFEIGQHQNNHSYEVIKNDFPLWTGSWTAAEERRLLEALAECGLGNWADVANQLKTKTRQQCEQHYLKHYINSPCPPLEEMKGTEIKYHPAPVVFKLSEDPPRPAEGSVTQLDMSGYMAARGDFHTEHDNFAEMDLRELNFEDCDDDIETEVKLAVIDVYRNCLKERQRRKRINRDYGLVNLKKLQVASRRYERTLGTLFDQLRVFYKLLPPVDFDMFVEGLHYEAELKQEIRSLQNFRDNGITRLKPAKIFERLRRRREEEKSKRHLLSDILNHLQDESACSQWLQRQAVLDNISKGVLAPLPSALFMLIENKYSGPCHQRPPLQQQTSGLMRQVIFNDRTAPPLDITTLPGYDKLNAKEKELCSVVRLVPQLYLEFKRVLVAENNKQGYLKLAQARNMIKIDVNKTRRIYDFLVQEGDILKDAAS